MHMHLLSALLGPFIAGSLFATAWEVSGAFAKVWATGNESNCGLLGCVSAPALSLRVGRELHAGLSLGIDGTAFAGPRGGDICFGECDGRSLRGFVVWVDATYVFGTPAPTEPFLRPRVRAGFGAGHLRYLDAQQGVHVYEGNSTVLDLDVGLRLQLPTGPFLDLSGRWMEWLSLPSPDGGAGVPDSRCVGLPGVALELGWSL